MPTGFRLLLVTLSGSLTRTFTGMLLDEAVDAAQLRVDRFTEHGLSLGRLSRSCRVQGAD